MVIPTGGMAVTGGALAATVLTGPRPPATPGSPAVFR
jgi:hypothetical protein